MSEVMTNSLVVALSNGGSAISSGATSITVSFVSGGTGAIPAVSSQTMRCYWDGEIISVTATSGGGNVTWTIVRGTENTVAVTHQDASLIYQIVSVAGLQQYVADQITGNLAAGAGITITPSGNVLTLATTFVLTLISSSVLGGATASVTFSSIPGTYRNLRLVLGGRSSTSAAQDPVTVQFNGDTGANYDLQGFYGCGNGATGTQIGAFQTLATAAPQVAYVTAATGAANFPGTADITIPGYAGTTFYKVALSVGQDVGGTTSAGFQQVTMEICWHNTAAITSILLKPASGANFVTGSFFYLYGY